MDTKLKNSYRKEIIRILLIVLLPAIITCCFYPMVHNRAMQRMEEHTDEESTALYDDYYGSGYMYDIYKTGYVLYEDFLKSNRDESSNNPDYQNVMAMLRDNFYSFTDYTDYFMMDVSEDKINSENVTAETNMVTHQDAVKSFILEGTPVEEGLYNAWICIQYDSQGNIKVLGYAGVDADSFAQEFQMYRMKKPIDNEFGISLSSAGFDTPRNMIVFYGLQSIENDNLWNNWYELYCAYKHAGILEVFLIMLLLVAFAAIHFRRKEAFMINQSRFFRLPLEGTLIGLFLPFAFLGPMVEQMVNYMYGSPSEMLDVPNGAAGAVFHMFFWTLMYLFWFWMIGCLAPMLQMGFWGYIKEYAWIYRFFPFMKRKWKQFVAYVQDVDITENMEKSIRKIVLVNGVIVAILCTMWFGGVIGVIIYSVLLFIFLRKYVTNIRGQYMAMLAWVRKWSSGDLNAKMEEDAGFFEPIKTELSHIQSGFKRAVEEEVKSQKMKTELITNVSHDLKTPLTAIITYVDLLKQEQITSKEREEFIRILDKKSMRLKALIEDLFEISKAASNNVTMHISDVDIVNLMKQVRLELEDKILESGLDVRWKLPEDKRILKLDSQKTYRIIENLLINSLKYSMPESRVYIEMKDTEDTVVLIIKNISSTELNFDPKEITERFVRGDLSRNTEGSGLGLAIAKSFAELQGGMLDIEIDGDLFKAIVTFRK